jgi:hypothetical protein
MTTFADDVNAVSFNTNSTVRSAFLKTTSSSQHAVTVYQAGTSGIDVASALNIISDNPESTCAYFSGHESARGTLKVAHHKPAASDANAAALSIDLQYDDATHTSQTSAQGIRIAATDGPTLGNLITAVNNGREDFVVKGSGRVGIRNPYGHTPAGALEVTQGDATAGIVVTASTGNAQIQLKDASGVTGTLYVEGGALKYRGSSGTVTTIAPA